VNHQRTVRQIVDTAVPAVLNLISNRDVTARGATPTSRSSVRVRTQTRQTTLEIVCFGCDVWRLFTASSREFRI
jgi:hypothetical protein